MENLKIWNALKRPPKESLRQINFGALKGKSDIDPMWRVKAMTEQFGPCGVGWKFEIKRVWNEPAPNDQTFAFAEVWVYIRINEGEWSDPTPGIGGNMLVQLAKGSPRENDEGYKMAVTDALGTALKMIGVAADIYMGKFDGSKYSDESDGGVKYLEGESLAHIIALHKQLYSSPNEPKFFEFAGSTGWKDIPAENENKILGMLNERKTAMFKGGVREPGSDDT